MNSIYKSFLIMIFTFFSFSANAQPGAIDLTFNPTDLGFGYGDGPQNNSVSAIAVQADSKIIIGGSFSEYNGFFRKSIARLNPNGTIDEAFSPGDGTNGGGINTIAIQVDGKIIIGGSFTYYDGREINRIARLNTNGTLDETFTVGTGANGAIFTSAIQSDGKIIIGGYFTSYNGIERNRIARLNTDGTLDTTFDTGTGANSNVNTIAIQTNGKIIIGGNFTYYNEIVRNRIARLNADGTLDTTFDFGLNGSIMTTAIQSNGKIIIGGSFTSSGGYSINRIARLNGDGTLDFTFNLGSGANNLIFTTTIQADGRIIIGGQFTDYNGTSINRIARLNTNGTLDETFFVGTGANGNVETTAIQNNGKIIIGGWFSNYNGLSGNRLTLLNSDGSFDQSFNPGMGANLTVRTIAMQPDDKIIIGGRFTSYNGFYRNGIARLNTDGTLDETFHPGGIWDQVIAIAMQSDGKIIIGGDFNIKIARLNADGTIDETFNIGTGPNHKVSTIAIQTDGKIIIGGDFTSYNGTSTNRIARLNKDGSLDNTFNSGSGTTNNVWIVAIQVDGKIIIGGTFTSYNSTAINNIARLNTDGTIDETFNIGTGPNNRITTISIQADGKIIIGGWFSSYNGISIDDIARLNTDGTLDETFNPGIGVNNTIQNSAIQADGKIIIVGHFTSYNGISINHIARLNADGTLDSTFELGSGANFAIWSTAMQSDGKIIIGGEFISYNSSGRNRVARVLGNSSTSISSIESVEVSIYPNPVSNNLTMENKANHDKVSFEIFNTNGNIVYNGYFFDKTNVSTSNFAPGVYLIKFNNGKTTKTKKIIKH